MRKLLVAAAIAVLAISLSVQAQSGGVTANGWEARLDRGTDASSVLNFMSMGDGVHATTSGRGAAIFWRPSNTHSGTYTISASFTQMEPSDHPNAYGLFFGGSNLSADNQRYSYFVIREDGQYLIKKRMGGQTPNVVSWTPHSAITGARRAGTGDERALGGSRQQSGSLPGERYGGVVAAAIRCRFRRDLRATRQPPAERAHRRPPARYVAGRTDGSLTAPRSAVYTEVRGSGRFHVAEA